MSRHKNSLQANIDSGLTANIGNPSQKSFKGSDYQSVIQQLSHQVKHLRQRLQEIQNQKSRQEPPQLLQGENKAQLAKMVSLLRQDNQALRRQNGLLRQRVKNLQAMVGRTKPGDIYSSQKLASVRSLRSLKQKPQPSMIDPISYKTSLRASNATSVTTNLLRQLLVQCNQPSQSVATKADRKIKDQFYQFKDTQDCFQPFFSNLAKQHRVRLKKCLLKQKDILYVDNYIQIGVISPYKPSPNDPFQQLRMVMVFTNLTPAPITNLCLEFMHGNDIYLQRKEESMGRQVLCSKNKTLFPQPLYGNEQIKEEIKVVINNIDFKCVKLTVGYQVPNQKQSQLLILPLSKLKLCRQLPFSSPSPSSTKIQRVFQHQPRVLPQLRKIQSFWGGVHVSEQKSGRKRYGWRLQLLGKVFWVQVGQVQQKIAVGVRFQSERALADKLLSQYVFLMQKI